MLTHSAVHSPIVLIIYLINLTKNTPENARAATDAVTACRGELQLLLSLLQLSLVCCTCCGIHTPRFGFASLWVT